MLVTLPSDSDANPAIRRGLQIIGATWFGSKLSDAVDWVEDTVIDAYEEFEQSAVEWYIRPYTDALEERQKIGDYDYLCPDCNGSYTGSHQCRFNLS